MWLSCMSVVDASPTLSKIELAHSVGAPRVRSLTKESTPLKMWSTAVLPYAKAAAAVSGINASNVWVWSIRARSLTSGSSPPEAAARAAGEAEGRDGATLGEQRRRDAVAEESDLADDAAAAAKAGAKGLLVPDIPLEETPELSEICASHGVDLVLLSTPTTPVERAKKIALASNGFIYLVSVTGVTGARSDVESRVQELVTTLKEVTEKPVCVGFGISKEAQAREVVEFGADGVIVGSALVRALGEAESEEEGLEKLEALAKELRRGANRV